MSPETKADIAEMTEVVDGLMAKHDKPLARTVKQNRALHKYFTMVADDMNAAGYDAHKVISLPISMTADIVKDCIFKVIMSAMFHDKTSTTELSTKELQSVHLVMEKAIGEKFGITTAFPCDESLSEEQR